mmetsp:Transcript_56108/g.47305  ORF Transcript_56108/g.47305 Transcript_56108/m.47305 type:complete len:80 (-) Transcript_56108:341-580(-)
MKVYFIRHGQAEHNVLKNNNLPFKHIFDPTLTKLGKEDCLNLNSQLKEQNIRFDVLITTAMSRAIETGLIVFKDLYSEA